MREERTRAQQNIDKLEKTLKDHQTTKGLELQNANNKHDQLTQDHANLQFECKRMQQELADLKVGKASQESALNNCQKDLQIKVNELEQVRSKEKESKTNEADLMMDNKKAQDVITDL